MSRGVDPISLLLTNQKAFKKLTPCWENLIPTYKSREKNRVHDRKAESQSLGRSFPPAKFSWLEERMLLKGGADSQERPTVPGVRRKHIPGVHGPCGHTCGHRRHSGTGSENQALRSTSPPCADTLPPWKTKRMRLPKALPLPVKTPVTLWEVLTRPVRKAQPSGCVFSDPLWRLGRVLQRHL